jgi:hypothetical protein
MVAQQDVVPAEVVESLGLAVPVAHIPVKAEGLPDMVEGLPQLGVGVLVAAEPGVSAGELEMGMGLYTAADSGVRQRERPRSPVPGAVRHRRRRFR